MKKSEFNSSRRSFNKWANSDPSEAEATASNLRSWIKQGFLDRDNLSDRDLARLQTSKKTPK